MREFSRFLKCVYSASHDMGLDKTRMNFLLMDPHGFLVNLNGFKLGTKRGGYICTYPFDYSHTWFRRQPPACAPRWATFAPSFAVTALEKLKNMRSARCVALWLRFFARTWLFDLDFARSGVPGTPRSSILKTETAVFLMFFRSKSARREKRPMC